MKKGGNIGLPFGLCEKYGIQLPPNARPRDAWEALKNKTGMSPEDFYKDLRQEAGSERVLTKAGSADEKYLKNAAFNIELYTQARFLYPQKRL